MAKAAVFALLLASCATGGQYPASWFPSVTKHPVMVTRHTPSGVALDDPGHELNETAVDEAFTAVEACLAAQPRKLTTGDTAQWGGMYCHRDVVPATIDRRSLTVKVAPDWHVSKCSGEQLFPCDIGREGCDAKNLPDVPGCPCQCRHAIQRGNVLVVTPDLKLLRAAIVEAATGCENPWAGRLKECTH